MLIKHGNAIGTKIDLPFNTKFPNTGYYVEDLLYKKSDKELWVSTIHGLFVFSDQGKLLKKMITSDEGLSKGYFARYLFKDAHGDVYFFSAESRVLLR